MNIYESTPIKDCNQITDWWLNPTPLKNMSQLRWQSQLNGKIEVPNHQAAYLSKTCTNHKTLWFPCDKLRELQLWPSPWFSQASLAIFIPAIHEPWAAAVSAVSREDSMGSQKNGTRMDKLWSVTVSENMCFLFYEKNIKKNQCGLSFSKENGQH